MNRKLALGIALLLALAFVGSAIAGSWRQAATKTGSAWSGFTLVKAVNRTGSYAVTFTVPVRATAVVDYCDHSVRRNAYTGAQVNLHIPSGGCTLSVTLFNGTRRGPARITLWRWAP